MERLAPPYNVHQNIQILGPSVEFESNPSLEEECRVVHGPKLGRNDIKRADEETLQVKLSFSYFTSSETDPLPFDSS